VDAAGRTYHDALLAAGARVHVYGPPMIHAKTAVLDDVAVVGTANLDDRSLKLNFEVAAVAYGGALPGQLSALFERDLARARERRRGDPRDPWGRRLLGSAARLLASQL
jgi:cardiolipin synthase